MHPHTPSLSHSLSLSHTHTHTVVLKTRCQTFQITTKDSRNTSTIISSRRNEIIFNINHVCLKLYFLQCTSIYQKNCTPTFILKYLLSAGYEAFDPLATKEVEPIQETNSFWPTTQLFSMNPAAILWDTPPEPTPSVSENKEQVCVYMCAYVCIVKTCVYIFACILRRYKCMQYSGLCMYMHKCTHALMLCVYTYTHPLSGESEFFNCQSDRGAAKKTARTTSKIARG